MNKRKILTCVSVAAAALLLGAGLGHAQTPGPVPAPTAINYDLPNYANSPLPVLDGTVKSIRVTDAGCGYSVAPNVLIDLPWPGASVDVVTNTAATASAALVANGAIAITWLSGGAGYLTTPNITIALPTGATCACPASAVAIMGVQLNTGLRKFIDSLPGLNTLNNLGQMIPTAIANAPYGVTPLYPGSDYYEIAVVDYREQMHSDLKDPTAGTPWKTKLRGYVQIVPSGYPGGVKLTIADAGLTYDTLNPATGQPYYGASKPYYLGPLIVATKNVPTRIKFYNLLPAGTAGKLFIPVDTTIMGAGTAGWALNTAGVQTYTAGGTFPENRATLHLHGGFTPWVSDGTPHQWTVPLGDLTTVYQKGVSSADVPDMPSGQGVMTFYYPNQQSGRLMFYHDHAYGITRLNVYAGEAAGYLLTDPDEDAVLVGTTTPPVTGPLAGVPQIPLVIQDKTFVWGAPMAIPSGVATDGTYAVDPIWATLFPGSTPGDLWFPHVYMANQNPADMITGSNPLGRWDYGPWFWPPQRLNVLPIPELSTVPESFMDTPVVNGTAYPYTSVPAGKVRLRLLNACNDRMLNLQLYQADPNGYAVDASGVPAPPLTGFGTEVAMVPATANPAIPFPDVWKAQTPGMIPEILDNRPGGVPDPRLRGPAMIQIGTEGGLLPSPVLLENTPVGYEQNKRNIVVLNVSQKTLFLGPAERADVIIDFGAKDPITGAYLYAGKTVILYNDSPAPVPAGDPRLSYYTGNEDYSSTAGVNNQGGAPSTLPGYGPNMRTIMQFRVAGIDPAPLTPATPDYYDPLLLTALGGDVNGETAPGVPAALPGLFKARNELPIVPEPTYPVASGGNSAVNTYAHIQDTSMSFLPAGGAGVSFIALSPLPATGGSGYVPATTIVTISAPPVGGTLPTTGVVKVDKKTGAITSIPILTPGSGYVTPPTVTITVSLGAPGAGAVAVASLATKTFAMQPKALHELFDTYGRMNSVLGVELPFTTFLIQTTIPYQYIDPTTEIIPAGQTQIWKLTHNGVDTHAIHFHLVNVQVINRVGWDGAIRLPDANELGWKETVRMNPLEDVIVAATAKPPGLPFLLPKSTRVLDVTAPLNSTAQFTGVNPQNGTPVTVKNAMTSFDWEYVWHCHLLGHEENDMMRPLVMTVAAAVKYTPTASATMVPANGKAKAPGPVTVTLNAVDFLGGPGIASFTYSATGAQPIALTTTTDATPVVLSFTVTGTTVVTFWATDKVGVTSVPKPQTVTVTLN